MSDVSLPIGSTNSGDNNWSDVYNNDNAIVTVVNGDLDNSNLSGSAGITDANLASPNNSVLRTIAESRFVANGGGSGGANITTSRSVATQGLLWDGTSTNSGSPEFLYFDPGDYDVAGTTTYFQIHAQLLCNATAPGINISVCLFPITAVAGGSGVLTVTTTTTDLSVAFATPSASNPHQAASSDTALSTAKYYAFGVVGNGTQAANSIVAVSAQVKVHNS